jgi:beta-glucanase (GH16 family)
MVRTALREASRLTTLPCRYQKDNAKCSGGNLVITSGKHDGKEQPKRKNPNFKRGSNDWKTSREHITYTSSAIQTKGKKDFGLGVFEMRAKVDVREGAWPAWWTLGSNIDDEKWSWPRCGEIDMMEVFGKSSWERGPVNKGNVIYGTAGWWDYKRAIYIQGKDERSTKKMSVDSNWGAKWHIFKMDRKATSITLYVDGKVINHFPLTSKNARDSFGPDKKIFMLVNLALGGCCGGNPDTNRDHKNKPFKFEVDYIRVYN